MSDVPLKDLNLKRGLLLAGIVRQNGQIVIPAGDDMLHPHDDVIVVTTDTAAGGPPGYSSRSKGRYLL